MKIPSLSSAMGLPHPPEETTTSSNVASSLMMDVCGRMVWPCTARTVEEGISNFSRTSLMVIGLLDSTSSVSPSY
ncbi:MAG: hypothetical protein VX461_03900 [Candidatus Thermoplasmatota archaeon]|nr:hypothetical protein [Candidatus Thermoplasmatota archaeon]